MRCGLIAKKIGMTRIFNDDGNSIPVSVLKIDNCEVISKKTKEKHGYNASQTYWPYLICHPQCLK